MDFYSEGKFSSLGPLSWPHLSGLAVGTRGSCRGLVPNLAAHTLEDSGFGLEGGLPPEGQVPRMVAAYLTVVRARAEKALEGRRGLHSQGKGESTTSVRRVCLGHWVPECVCSCARLCV